MIMKMIMIMNILIMKIMIMMIITDEQPIDTLLIECSGLSEVLPVAQTFFADPYVT